MRVVAAADLHLGMRFAVYDEVSDRLAEARFDALDRVVEEANREEADLLVIAGDLFDRRGVPAGTIDRAVASLAAFEGGMVAVLPGNHDYWSGADAPPWDRFGRACADAKLDLLLLSESRAYELSGYGLQGALLPGPCMSKHRDTHAIGWAAGSEAAAGWEAAAAPAEAGTDPRSGTPAPGVGAGGTGGQAPTASERTPTRLIGIAHGSIAGISPDTEGRYYPMGITDFEATPADIWIVGHTHLYEHRTTRPGQHLVIPGTPEPDGFDCRHGGTCAVIDVSDTVEVRCAEIGTYRFVERTLDPFSTEGLERLSHQLDGLDAATTLLRVHVSGSCNGAELDAFRRLVADWRERFPVVRIDDSRLTERITHERLGELYPEGSFPYRLLSDLLEAGDTEAVETAFRFLENARESTQ